MNVANRFATTLALATLLCTCAEPVAPKFQFETGFLLIEGRITDTPGYSEVRVARNEILFEIYTLTEVDGAQVSSIDSDGVETQWSRSSATQSFRPPTGWAATAGKSYFIRVVTPAGEVVESAPEVVPTSVPIANPRVIFEQEAFFSTGRNRFIPAFRLLVDVDDPAGERNYYQYRYTTFQTIEVCASCERSRWRNGVCIPGPDTRFVSRWDYLCDARCWVRSSGADINIMSDEFGAGQRITGIQAGQYEFDRLGRLLFDVQQYSISQAAYEYSSVLKDLADGAGGLNAPLPAALVGNLTDVSENRSNVLGFVGVAAVSQERIMILRDTFGGTPLEFTEDIRLEPVIPSPPVAPCEGTGRTRDQPEGWVD